MQLDMHYYATYALARIAGLKPHVCKIIATAAQFVDDNATNRHIEFQDGARIDAQATAHHVASIIANRDPEDQRKVWVPFHFMPGNSGENFSERMVCEKDSQIIREMVTHHLKYAKRSVGGYLMGIAAHVCADAYSHYGFSGLSSRHNKVDNDSFIFDEGLEPAMANYIHGKAADFFRYYGEGGGLIANTKSWLAETISGALGHGAVATYPDRPYLKWSYAHEYPKRRRVQRNNPRDYLSGCRMLHRMFTRYAKNNPRQCKGDGLKFSAVKQPVADILSFQGRKKDRIRKWRSESQQGNLGGMQFRIPSYAPVVWLKESVSLAQAENSAVALRSNLYRFYQAASIHRQFVLRELLPAHALIVA